MIASMRGVIWILGATPSDVHEYAQHAFGGLMSWICIGGPVVVLMFLWAWPIIEAVRRGHPRTGAIVFLTVMCVFIVTIPLWIVAMVWALSWPVPRRSASLPVPLPPPPIASHARLTDWPEIID
jgi:hypothetical protein